MRPGITLTPFSSGIIFCLYPGGVSLGYEMAMTFRLTQNALYLNHLLKASQQ